MSTVKDTIALYEVHQALMNHRVGAVSKVKPRVDEAIAIVRQMLVELDSPAVQGYQMADRLRNVQVISDEVHCYAASAFCQQILGLWGRQEKWHYMAPRIRGDYPEFGILGDKEAFNG